MPELSAIVPAWNEASLLRESLRAIADALAKVTPDYEIVVVDDGSTDATWPLIKALHLESPRLLGMRLARHYGKEGAVAAGLDSCRGAAAIIIDADLQHPLEMIPTFYRLWKEEGYEVVNGVKNRRESEPLVRRALSSLFSAAATLLTGIRLDGSADFKLLDRKVIEAWRTMPERRTFFRGMVAWLGFRSARCPSRLGGAFRGGPVSVSPA